MFGGAYPLRLSRWISIIAVSLLAVGLPARAQVNPFGLLGFLNPEGTRLFPSALIAPRHPGKPDPRWRLFDWKYIDFNPSDSNLRLYFYEEERWTARFAVDELQTEIAYLKEKFQGFVPKKQFNYLLFTSHREFQQTNVFNISEGVEGITSTQEATMAVPYWGESETFKHISTHEMTHQFQFQKLNEANKWGAEKVDELTPLWFVEGMAEYYSLHGEDPETRAYIRDVILYPNDDHGQIIPKFFEQPVQSFVQVYKMGQTKLDFMEKTYGKGTIQKVLDAVDHKLGGKVSKFDEVMADELKTKPDEIEKKWREYIDHEFKTEIKKFTQKLGDYTEVKDVPDTVDLFDVSPDGSTLLTREMDEVSGVTSLYLRDAKDPAQKTMVAQDFETGTMKLYFMEMPTVGISDDKIYFVAETIRGPELVVRSYSRDGKKVFRVKPDDRFSIYNRDLIEAHSPTLSRDGKTLAFVGLDKEGRENVFTIDISAKKPMKTLKRLTHDVYSWKNLSWDHDTIYAQSDRTSNGKTAIFRIDAKTGRYSELTFSDADQGEPSHDGGRTVFQSMESGSSQIHMLADHREVRLTDAPTALSYPKLRGDTLYAIALKGGRFKLYQIPKSKWLNIDIRPIADVAEEMAKPPNPVPLADLNQYKIRDYKPFISSGTRLENLGGFISTGTVIGLSGAVSDLMRDYMISGDFFLLGGIKNSEADLILSDFRGRTKWTTGTYYTIRQSVDTQLSTSSQVNYYFDREVGALFSMEYPFGPFDFIDAELRVAGVNRTDYSDPNTQSEFDAMNPGMELMLAPVLRYGYDKVLYEAFTGPLKGYAVLFEGDTDYYPRRFSLTERGRVDAAYYWQIKGETVWAFQLMGAAAWGLHNGTFLDSFFVSSPDIFRAYPFDDVRLLGNYVVGGKTEFRFPIGSWFKFPPLRGLLSYDWGSIYVHPDEFGTDITSSYAAGLDLNIPPISVGLIFGFPLRVAPGPRDAYVTHFVLRYLYL